MPIRLIAFDMDGTLLDSDKNLPQGFTGLVRSHPEIKFVIASGRQYFTLAKDFPSIRDQLIFAAENGGIVFEQERILYQNEMRKEDILDCLARIAPYNHLTPIVCGAGSAYIKPAKEHILREAGMYYERLKVTEQLREAALADSIIKIAVFADGNTAEASYPYFAHLKPHLAAVLSGDCWIDIANQTVNKGAAIRAIRQKYDISRAQSMAFGDYLNDAELLKSCEESYCMANGHPALKALAKHIADSNDNNGVMKALFGAGIK